VFSALAVGVASLVDVTPPDLPLETVAARRPRRAVVAPFPRVALTLEEAAEAMGVSLSHLRRHILPDLRVIRSGSVRLVPVTELNAWAEREATYVGNGKLSGV
jgi:excisionase family DNA binding protein